MLDWLGDQLLKFFGISPDPINNLRGAIGALRQQPTIDFFSAEYFASFGVAFGIALVVSLAVTGLSAIKSLRPGESLARTVLVFGYYGETLLVGSLMLLVAKWVDTGIAALRAATFGMLPENIESQFILSQGGVGGAMIYDVISGIATGILKIEADVFSNMGQLLAMAFIVIYPLYHLEAGPLHTIVRWLVVALAGTLMAMLWMLGGALVINVALARGGSVQPVNYRMFSTIVLILAAFTPLMLNSYLKRSRIGQRIMGAVRVSNLVSTRGGAITTAQPVLPSKTKSRGQASERIRRARDHQHNSGYMRDSLKKPENLLMLYGPTRPVGTAISIARGLRRK